MTCISSWRYRELNWNEVWILKLPAEGVGGGALPYESEGLDARRLTRVHIADFSLT